MKIYSTSETKKFILSDIESILRWECPNCCQTFDSEEGQSKSKFINHLMKVELIRRVETNVMIGCFCKDCYSEPEFENMIL